jgi:hypothetical protein
MVGASKSGNAMPKPSAWEFYLRQDGKTNTPPVTYGDLPGVHGGDLAGRKYYRHQGSEQVKANIETGNEHVNESQATLARYICDVGTRFKFAIRFALLRAWELGALLAVLEPARLAGANNAKKFVHTLGLGRPLGMGSVCVNIDKMRIRLEKDVQLPEEDNRSEYEGRAINALREKLTSPIISAWLKLHQFPDPTLVGGPISYPMEAPRTTQPPTIYDWHTNLRRDYSKLRRERAPNWERLRRKMRDANPDEGK